MDSINPLENSALTTNLSMRSQVNETASVGIDAMRRRMGRESPDDVVNLISFRAGFLARPASVGIRLARALLRQIYRCRNSSRLNRPASDEISFSVYPGDVDRPGNSISYTAPVVTTGARNRRSLHCSGPTHRSGQQSDSRWLELLSEFVVKMTTGCLSRSVGIEVELGVKRLESESLMWACPELPDSMRFSSEKLRILRRPEHLGWTQNW